MMTSRSLLCLLENQNGGKLQKILLKNMMMNLDMYIFSKNCFCVSINNPYFLVVPV
jgi:hypothetical protein